MSALYKKSLFEQNIVGRIQSRIQAFKKSNKNFEIFATHFRMVSLDKSCQNFKSGR